MIDSYKRDNEILNEKLKLESQRISKLEWQKKTSGNKISELETKIEILETKIEVLSDDKFENNGFFTEYEIR
jgi:hypothetical protein